ncbi:MAG TPA: TA system VapC family ribonuclease toxin [Thermoanaerobaculia bacterium]|nr:TA system VapC family ribonuclease toxin [Thermoanaerobaculia bacterium]
MRAIDTNVLVYSEIISSTHHRVARRLVTELAEGVIPWAIPWPCVYEFLRVVTHPRVFSPPVPLAVALHDLGQILLSPSLVLLSETERHGEVMKSLVRESGVTGNLLHDAHIAALCIEHGVGELLTGDRDFSRFPLSVNNPFR